MLRTVLLPSERDGVFSKKGTSKNPAPLLLPSPWGWWRRRPLKNPGVFCSGLSDRTMGLGFYASTIIREEPLNWKTVLKCIELIFILAIGIIEEMIKIGIVGLDSSHVSAFSKLLHDKSDRNHVDGGKIIVAFAGGSPDMEISRSRVEKFTAELRDVHSVKIVDSIEEVAEISDGILLESVDGRIHLDQFKQLAPYAKPVFIDKPMATNPADAKAIVRIAKETHTRLMSTSALRYAESFRRALNAGSGKIVGLDVFGPMPLQPQMPGFYWYGIHCLEMLVAALGRNFKGVKGASSLAQDVLIIEWENGIIGTLRSRHHQDAEFGGCVHFENAIVPFKIDQKKDRPLYSSLLSEIMIFFEGKGNSAPGEEALAVIKLADVANRILGYQ
jgi:predicted dehydrogenase